MYDVALINGDNMAYPAHKPTDELREKVASLKAFGNTHEAIAASLSIDNDTLVKYYKEELTNGATNANHKVASVLFDKCMAGDTSALIFYLKTRARWREKDPEDNNPMQSLVERLVDKLVES